MKKNFTTLLLLYALGGTPIFAQQSELEPVTVTASLQPVTVSKTGRNITVIKGEDISKFPVNSIDELLRYLPGVEVQARGPMGSQSDIVLRGGTFQQVLVILDGIRLNDPNTGHFNSYIPIVPTEIARIEILKGASSAIYGSEAVGGVVHIITKTFDAKQQLVSRRLSAQTAIGTYGLWNTQAGGFYKNDKTAFSAGLLSNNADGQQQRGSKGYFHNNTISMSVSHKFSDAFGLSFRSAFDSRSFAAQNFYTTFLSDTATEDVTTYWNQLKLTYQKQLHRFSLDVGYKSVRDEYAFNSIAAANLNKTRLLQSLATYSVQANKTTDVTAGFQWIQKRIISNDRGDHNVNQAAAFLLLTKSINSKLYLAPALRLEYNDKAGWELVPQMNVSYNVKHWQWRASAGKTTRDADFTERYNNYNKALVTSGSIGNPDLSAEESFSYEAGVDYVGVKQFRISGTFFQRHNRQLIDYVPTPYELMPRKINLTSTGSYALAKNIADVRSTGFETDVKYVVKLSEQQNIMAGLGIVWLQSVSSDTVPSFYLSSHARWLTNFNLNYRFKQVDISVSGLYKDRLPREAQAINAVITKDYFVLNAKVAIMIWQDKIGCFAQADNIFNKRYSDLLGSVMPGRWIMTGIKASL